MAQCRDGIAPGKASLYTIIPRRKRRVAAAQDLVPVKDMLSGQCHSQPRPRWRPAACGLRPAVRVRAPLL